MRPKLAVKIGKLKLKNPVMAASGTFGYGEEFGDFIDLTKLGAIVSKTITLRPRRGNLPPRTCEAPAGMLNSIGLENPGLEAFISQKLPLLSGYGVPVIVSISSVDDPQEFVELARSLDKLRPVAGLELNISCPNIKRSKVKGQRSRLISHDPRATYETVKLVRRATNKILITKLSPNVTDITEIALSAEKAGSDAVSLVNTFIGMGIDIAARRPKISTVTAGLSGPAIRPIAVRMVWEVYQKINIPIIGMGGIIDTPSALEFFIAGASVIALGTANFINPKTTIAIIKGLSSYLRERKIYDIQALTGSLRV